MTQAVQWFAILYDTLMMALNFLIFWRLLRAEYVSNRAVMFFSSIILYMAAEGFALGYIIYEGGSPIAELPALVLASVPLLVSGAIKPQNVRLQGSVKYSLLLATSLVVDEMGMGYLYAKAFGVNLGNWLVDSVSNVAFGLMMLADALFFLLVSRRRGKPEYALFTFATAMVFLPNVVFVYGKMIMLIFSILSSVIMIINIVLLYLVQLSGFTFRRQFFAISMALLNFLMMYGLSDFAVTGSLVVLSLTSAISMAWYLFAEVWESKDVKIEPRPGLTFLFLVLVNLAELAMGFGMTVFGFRTSLDLFMPSSASGAMGHMHAASGQMGMSSTMSQSGNMPSGTTSSMSMGMGGHMSMMRVQPWSSWDPLWWLFPFDIYSMMTMMKISDNALINMFWSSYMLIMMTTMSPFYVIMMGSEMAFLVWERYRRAKNLGVKRWALVILVSIPIFVVLVPFYTPFYVFGMSGMIIPVEVIPYLISLAAVAIAVILLGRRAYCNAVCMAAHMWTNVWYDQFKPKRHWRGWDYLRWAFLVPAIIVLALYPLYGLGLLQPPAVKLPGAESFANFILDFYGMFVLNYVWWFFFFLTPIFGAYSCARQGWCGFGTLAGLGNKVFFKVKANSVETCKACRSVECEGACPVKIPIRSDVLLKGYTNRIACVGCGDCVEACPYDNLTIRSLIGR
ncbi:MAG: 4Fe-4S binding protein [Sulfolobales archaeon]|nr:4Fe-4S binding protein [Sulfolobales archaeon]